VSFVVVSADVGLVRAMLWNIQRAARGSNLVSSPALCFETPVT